jgi:uncharacterized protein YecE (DUF72 family)
VIRVGVGGWHYPPWRGTFYPPGLPHARELQFASRQLTAIEINVTFRRTQTRAEFRRWADETPDDFVFTVKAPGYVVGRRKLADAGSGIARFLDSGVAELRAKLGPILWQLPPTKPFDEAEMTMFLAMLPAEAEGVALWHAIEVRHASFAESRFVALARRYEVPIVYADSERYPAISDLTGPFVYVRLQRATEAEPEGYAPAELDKWADRARVWAEGRCPADLPRVGEAAPGSEAAASPPGGRPVFMFVIHEGKLRAPAAAQALVARLRDGR